MVSRVAKAVRRGVFAALVLTPFTAGTAAAQQDTLRLGMDEVIERALRNSPQIVQAQGAVQTASSAERTAMGAFLPNLNFSSGATLASTQRFDPNTSTMVSGSSDSYSAGLSTSLDLFTGGRRGADLARSRAQTNAAEASLVEQRYAVERNAKAAYFDVLRAGDLIRSAEARIERAQNSLEAAERRNQVGSATRSDVLRAQLEVTNSRQALLQATSQKRVAMFNLGRVVGVDGPVDAVADRPLVVRELDFTREDLIEMATARSPAIISALANEATAEAGVRSARAQYLPSLSSSGSYNWSNDAPSFSDVRGSWSMRLNLSFPVFNRFQREDGLERAQVQATVARIQLSDARRAALANLERVLSALETSREQIRLAQEALAVAEEDMRVQQERYRLGVSTILEQVTSQENLVSAENNLIAARYDYQLALADLAALIGREP